MPFIARSGLYFNIWRSIRTKTALIRFVTNRYLNIYLHDCTKRMIYNIELIFPGGRSIKYTRNYQKIVWNNTYSGNEKPYILILVQVFFTGSFFSFKIDSLSSSPFIYCLSENFKFVVTLWRWNKFNLITF